MPFTFSHPAIILPLAKASKTWFSLTGLIIGSITPDFEYFIRMRVQSEYSHTGLGLLWFNLPLGIALAFLFHTVIRNKLIENLPDFLAYRFSPFKLFDWNACIKQNSLIVITSVLAGTLSHVAWDSFTHQDGYMVENFKVLENSVLIFGKDIPIYKLLQHGSSLAGAIVILLYIRSLPILPFKKSGIARYWTVVLVISTVVVGIRLATDLNSTAYGHLIVTGISGLMIGLVLASAFQKYFCGIHKNGTFFF